MGTAGLGRTALIALAIGGSGMAFGACGTSGTAAAPPPATVPAGTSTTTPEAASWCAPLSASSQVRGLTTALRDLTTSPDAAGPVAEIGAAGRELVAIGRTPGAPAAALDTAGRTLEALTTGKPSAAAIAAASRALTALGARTAASCG